jgi:hypothetical protein
VTGLGIRRNAGETWLEAALRLAAPWHLEVEIREHYEASRSRGVSEEEAAWGAVMEWDVAELLEGDE